MFFGFDYTAFKDENATNLMRANVITGGVNFITSRDKDKESFLREATLLKQALQLCRSLLTPEERYEAAYFEAVRTILTRIVNTRKPL